MARKNLSGSRRRVLLLALVGAGALSPSASWAADFWWRGDLSSTWSDNQSVPGFIFNTNFNIDSFGTIDRNALPGSSDVVRFAHALAGNLNTTLGTNFSINGLTTESGFLSNVSIAGSTLTLGSGGIVTNAISTLTITSALATSTGTHTISMPNASSVLNLNGTIGFAAMSKSGPGLLRIGGLNQSTSTVINGGTVRLNSGTAYLGGTPLRINSGTFDLGGFNATVSEFRFGSGVSGGPRNIINSVGGTSRIVLNGGITYTGPGAPAIVSVPIALDTNPHVIENTGGVFSDSFYDIVINGPLSGFGGFTKRGNAYLALTQPNIHSGTTLLEDGRTYAAAVGALSPNSDLDIRSPARLFLDPTTATTEVAVGNYFQQVRSLRGSGNISLGSAELKVDGPATTTYSGVISGTGRLSHSGTGKLTLTGANTNSGGVAIVGGTVEVGNGGTTGSVAGPIDMFAGSLVFNRSNDSTFAGGLTGSGPVTKLGAGTLTLSGQGSLTGQIFVRQGQITTAATNALGQLVDLTIGDVTAAATARVNTGGFTQVIRDLTMYSRASISQTALDVGTGTLRLEGNITVLDTQDNPGNNFPTFITAGAGGKLQLFSELSSSNQTITVAGQSNGGNDLIIQPVITGAAGLVISANPSTVNGAAAGVVFAAASANTYEGDTTVNAGLLTVNSTTSLGAGGLILNTTGNVGSAVTLNNASQTVRKLQTDTIGTVLPVLTLIGTALTVNGAETSDFSGIIGGTGSLTFDTFDVFLRRPNTYTGPTTIRAGSRVTLINTGSISEASAIAVNGRLVLSRSNAWGNHTTTTSAPITIGPGGSVESDNTFTTLVNLTLQGGRLIAQGLPSPSFGAFALKGTVTASGTVASEIVGFSTDRINIGTTAVPGSTTFNVADSTGDGEPDLTVEVVLQNNRNDADTAAQPSGLIKTGPGTLLLTAANTYTGGTTISAGTLRLGNSSSDGSVIGNITNNATLDFATSNDVTYAGSISGSGNVVKSSFGLLRLTGTSTYTGTTTLTGGETVVEVANALPVTTMLAAQVGSNAPVLRLAAPQTLASLSGTGLQIQNDSVLTINQSSNTQFNGTIVGSGSFVKSGTGTFTYTGVNASEGTTTVRGGTLALGPGGNLPGFGDVSIGEASIRATARLNLGGTSQSIGGLRLFARRSGQQVAVDIGAGTLTLTGPLELLSTADGPGNNFGAIITASPGGTLDLGGGTLNITLAGQNFVLDELVIGAVITNGGINLTANPSTFNGFAAGMILNASAPNTYDLGTTVNAGTLAVNASTTLGPGPLVLKTTGSVSSGVVLNNAAQTIASLSTGTLGTGTAELVLNGTALTVDQMTDTTFAGVISGSGSLTKSGGSVLTLTGNNTFGGGTTISGGFVEIGNGGTTGMVAGNINNNSALGFNRSDNITFPGNISGVGELFHLSQATVTLSGVLSYTGTTRVNPGGRLILNSALNTTTGDVVLSTNGKVDFARARTTSPVVVSTIDNLTVPAGGIARVTRSTRTGGLQQGVLIVNTLSITGSGFVDLTNNDLVVRGQSVASVRTLVGNWYRAAGGLPGTTGLGSSEAFYTVDGAFTTLAVYDNSIPGQTFSTFEGVAVASTHVLVKYTYLGDTNLDGIVNATDLARVLQGMRGQGSGWNFGDVNYDGLINAVDLGRTMAALRGQGAPLGGSELGGGGVIPEPSCLGALVAVVPLMGRRRR